MKSTWQEPIRRSKLFVTTSPTSAVAFYLLDAEHLACCPIAGVHVSHQITLYFESTLNIGPEKAWPHHGALPWSPEHAYHGSTKKSRDHSSLSFYFVIYFIQLDT